MMVCGGTAGHINPALAVAGELRARFPDAEFLFIGAGRPLEKKLIPAAGFSLENLTVTGFTRSFSPEGLRKNAAMLKQLAAAQRASREILEEFRPDVVFGTGGYVCYPVMTAAHRMGVPTAVHESNAAPGMTTKLLSGKVDSVMVTFAEAAEGCRKPDRVTVTGTPVRKGFAKLNKASAKRRLGIDGRPLVVSFWGSLGAARMNEMTADLIKRNANDGLFWHIHATGGGEAGTARMMDMLRQRGMSGVPTFVDIRPYIEDMDKVMNAADLVICRSGASTTAELTDVGVPAVLVPSPNVTGNHQEKNARALERAGAAKVLLENECSGDMLYETVKNLLNDSRKLARMARDAKAAGTPDAAARIADILLGLIN